MKIGRSLVDLAREIERQRFAKRDYIGDTRHMRLLDDGQYVALENAGTFRVAEHTLRQIGDRVGIPARYLRKMQEDAPALLAKNVNHWFSETPERRMLRTLDDGARAFLSDRYRRVDNHEIAEAALPVLLNMPGMRVLSSEITESRLYIKAATEALRGEIKSRRVGDIVEAGVVISNSEIGLGAVSIAPFAYFLACTNGMVREGGKRWARLGRAANETEEVYELLSDEARAADDRALLLKVRDTLTATLEPQRFQSWLTKLTSATEQKLEGDPVKAVEFLRERLSFTEKEKTSVLRHLIEGGDLTRYGVINAVTRTAEDVESYDRASEFEAFGGLILNLAPTEWREVQQAA